MVIEGRRAADVVVYTKRNKPCRISEGVDDEEEKRQAAGLHSESIMEERR